MADPRVFNVEVYFQAALEHMTAAERLLESGSYSSACYLAGLAVECLFHAYRHRREPDAEMDTTHDLRRLGESARFYEMVPEVQQEEARAAVAAVWLRWKNTHRYRSEAALRRYFTGLELFRYRGRATVQGNVVAFNSHILIDAATQVVRLGELRWIHSLPA